MRSSINWCAASSTEAKSPVATCGLIHASCSGVRVIDISVYNHAQREIVEDRAVRPIVSVAGADELAERLRYRLHFGDALLKVADMRFGDAFHVAARTAAIAPQGQESADFRNRKPEPARPPDETELVDVAFAVVAVGVAAARRGAQQADRLVMADHLRMDAARRRRRADIHVENPLDLPMIGRFRPARNRRQGDLRVSPADAKSALAKDHVCGMSVDMASAKHKAEHGGATFYFCSAGCREKFVAEPTRYLSAVGAVHSLSSDGRPFGRPMDRPGRLLASPAHRARLEQGRIYTCPMHPQIRRNGPGNCPICGMALEPEIAAATE